MDEKRCTSSNVIMNFPSTNKRQNPTCFFHIKDQKAEKHDFSKATPESIRSTLSNFQEKSFPISNSEFYNQSDMSKL